MDEIIQQCLTLSQKIQLDILNDNILDASESFTKLQNIQNLVKTLANEIELTKLASQANIINYLKRLRYDIQILESPLSTIEDIQRLSSDAKSVYGGGEIASGITIISHVVPDESFIPDSTIYYISSTGEYALKVNGMLIKGLIKPPDEKGFKSGNWIYTKEPLNSKNKCMRHIGDPKNLSSEISNSTKKEKDLRCKQLAHDLLINLAIFSQNKNMKF